MMNRYTALNLCSETRLACKIETLTGDGTKCLIKNLLTTFVGFPTIELIRSINTICMFVAKFLPSNACTIIAFKLIRLTNSWWAKLSTFVRWISTIRNAIAYLTGCDEVSIPTGEVICGNLKNEQKHKSEHFEHDCKNIQHMRHPRPTFILFLMMKLNSFERRLVFCYCYNEQLAIKVCAINEIISRDFA